MIREMIKENNRNAKHQQDLLQHQDDVCKCIPAGTHGSTPHLTKTVVSESPLRIRKLTPKECWRLMGFDDADFEKAQVVNSNTQLYKQAGNSIVVPVLEHIFRKLIECGMLLPMEKMNIEQTSVFENPVHFDMPEEFTVSRKYLRRVDQILSLLDPCAITEDELADVKKLISDIIDEGIMDERKNTEV